MPRKPKTKTTKTTKTTKDDKRYRESLVAAHTYYRTGTHVSNLFKKLAKVYTEHPEFVIVVVGMIISTIFRIGSAPAQRIIINILERAKVYGGDAAAYVHLMWKRLFHGPPPPPPPKPRWGVPALPAIPSLAPLMTFITELIKGGGSIGLEIYWILQEAYKMNPSFFIFIVTIVSSFVYKFGGQGKLLSVYKQTVRKQVENTQQLAQGASEFCEQTKNMCQTTRQCINVHDALEILRNPHAPPGQRNEALQTLYKFNPNNEAVNILEKLRNSKLSPRAKEEAKAQAQEYLKG